MEKEINPNFEFVQASQVLQAQVGCVAKNKPIWYSQGKRGIPMTEQNPFKWHHFQAKIILLSVRWYLRYSLSYRNLEEMMLERGLQVHHTTIYRWLQHDALSWNCVVALIECPRQTPSRLMRPTSK